MTPTNLLLLWPLMVLSLLHVAMGMLPGNQKRHTYPQHIQSRVSQHIPCLMRILFGSNA